MVKGLLEKNQIYQGDATTLLGGIAADSIALSFWSPPYFVGKPYERELSFNEWKKLLAVTIEKHFPIIKPGGFLIINIADILSFKDSSMPRIQANVISRLNSSVTKEDVLRAKEKYPDYNRYQLAEILGCSEQTVDRRLHGNNIRGGKYMPQTKVYLVGGVIQEWAQKAGFYLYDRRMWAKDPAWQNSSWHSLSYRAVDEVEYLYIFWKPGVTCVDRTRLSKKEWSEWGYRAVWRIASVRANNDHPAKFPLELARRVIRLFSSKGDTVLDCFMGSGTTAVAAIIEGRDYLGIELSEEYIKLSKENCRLARQKYPHLFP